MATNPHSIVDKSGASGGSITGISDGGVFDPTEFSAKSTPVAADKVVIQDTDDGNLPKVATLTNVQKILGEIAAGANATSGLSETDGVLKVNVGGTTANTDPATTDKLLIEVVGVNKSVTIANAIKAIGEAMINAATATSGLAETDGVVKIDIGNVTPTTAPAPADKLLIEVTGVNKSTTITNLVKAVGEAMVNAATATSGISEVDGVVKVDIGTVTAVTSSASTDKLMIEVTGVNKSITIGNFAKGLAETMAGDGLSGSSVTGALAVDLNELSGAGVDVANDSIPIVDATDNSSKKEQISDLIDAVAPSAAANGLVASAGTLTAAIMLAHLVTDEKSALFVETGEFDFSGSASAVDTKKIDSMAAKGELLAAFLVLSQAVDGAATTDISISSTASTANKMTGDLTITIVNAFQNTPGCVLGMWPVAGVDRIVESGGDVYFYASASAGRTAGKVNYLLIFRKTA